jgi:Ca2+/H+ antiporter
MGNCEETSTKSQWCIAYFIHLVVRLRVHKDIYERVKEATMQDERNNKFQ